MSNHQNPVILLINQKQTSIVADTLVLCPPWLIPEKWNMIPYQKNTNQYYLISSISKQYLHVQKVLNFFNLQISTLSSLWFLEDNHLYQNIHNQKMYIYIDETSNTIQASPMKKSMITFRSTTPS
jgi:hypothetical protein